MQPWAKPWPKAPTALLVSYLLLHLPVRQITGQSANGEDFFCLRWPALSHLVPATVQVLSLHMSYQIWLRLGALKTNDLEATHVQFASLCMQSSAHVLKLAR
jgi:hypothetical protein